MKFWSYKYLQKLFLLVFVLVTVVNIRFVQADTSPGGCQTNIMKNSEQCSWDEFKSWSANSTNSCVVEKTGCTNTASTTGNVFCNTPLAFSVCECKTGYFNCSTTGICIQRTPAANCGGYNSCTGYCTSCITGYTISNGGTASAQCLGATLKLGPDSVSGATAVVQSTNNTLMYLGGSGVSIGTSTIPGATALNVVGATMFSENLSMIHNKSIKVDNADSNTTLLIGNYGDGQGFGYGASTTRTASLVVEGDVKANRLCIKEDCRAEWTDIQGTSYWTASSTYIYNNNSGNVGIGDNEPYNKLSVGGNITGSGSLVITGTATSSNYFISNLGVGGLPNGFWNKFVDLSGSGNSAYIVKTGSINAVVAASDSGTPAGTGYNFTHSGQQMVLGTVTNQPLNFITNGGSKMFLSADGKLGIGTTAPGAKLDVSGNTNIDGLLTVYRDTFPVTEFIRSYDGPAIAWISRLQVKGTPVNGKGAGFIFTAPSYNGSDTTSAVFGGGLSNINTRAGYLTFATAFGGAPLANRSDMMLTATGVNSGDSILSIAGSVGIGTTSPLAKLDVDGSLSVRGSVAFSGPLYINGGSRLLMVDNAGNVSATTTQASVSMPAGTNGQTLRYGTSAWEATSTIFVKDGGNVGIGTTSPSSRLSLYGTPTIAGGITFNSTNTGFFSGSANEINAALNGSTEFRLNANFLDLYDNSRLRLVNEAPSATNPVFVPYGNDDDTGLGYAATNTLSLIANGVNGLNINSLGYAGVGTTTPGYRLDVQGTAHFTGTVKVATPIDASDAVTKSYLDSALITSTSSDVYVKKAGDNMTGDLDMGWSDIIAVNKLTVTTIDPLYDIGGTKYSTYAPSVVGGVKEEYVGKGEISQCDDQVCSWRLNFAQENKGSDLWVWRQIVDFQPDKVDVLMTAYGRPTTLSYEIDDNQLIFYANRPTRFSYRLIGARYDWRQWPTLAIDQTEKASLIIK